MSAGGGLVFFISPPCCNITAGTVGRSWGSSFKERIDSDGKQFNERTDSEVMQAIIFDFSQEKIARLILGPWCLMSTGYLGS